MKATALLCLTLAAWSAAGALAGTPVPVATNDAARWLRFAVPLPKEISLPQKLVLPANAVAVRSPDSTNIMATEAVTIVQTALGTTSPAVKSRPAAEAQFSITLQLGGSDAEPLRRLTNAAQAYRIFRKSVAAGDARASAAGGLRLVALEPRGLLYAARTLAQLLRRHGPEVEIPLLEVTDWPDLEDRGLWGADTFECVPWLAARKLNYIEQITAVSVDPQSRHAEARPKSGHEPLLTLGPRLGVQFVPVVLHLEQLSGKGLFEAYPQLRAQGGREGAICYSQPEIVTVLADWLGELNALPGVEEVDVWMAENLGGKGGCRCDACRKTDRSVLELRTILAAWQRARARSGPLGLRVLTSEETYPSHKALLAELPPDVKLWYYHSLLTYTAMERPMITGEVARLAASGHWVGVCPSLVAHVGFWEPFSGAQFVHFRAEEFVRRGVRGVIGYAVPRTRFNRFNVEALAEWTWNAAGRTPREFALAWATREGLREPEKFAEWSETLGPVAWDIYGSDWPAGEQRRTPGPVAELLRKGELPAFGEVKWGLYACPWGDFKSAAQLEAASTAAARAVTLAHEVGVEEFLQESLVVQGYADALKALWELKQLVTKSGIATENQVAAAKHFKAYLAALEQSAQALPDWERTVAEGGGKDRWVAKPVDLLRKMSEQMQATARGMGALE